MVSKSLFSAGGAPNPRSALILAISLVTSITLLWFLLWSGGSGGGLTPYGFYGLGAGSQNPFSRVPQTVLVDVEFYEHDDYKDLSPENDHLWEDLLTGNGGFLVQEDPDEGQLRRYGIGMFHQLHCLQMIRGSLQAAEMPGGSGANHAHGQHAHSGDASGKAHVLHCLDYLRQVSFSLVVWSFFVSW